MRYTITTLMIALFFGLTSFYAHKDRIERPISFKFTFKKGDTINVKTPNAALLEDIINQKKEIKEAQLTFITGEIMIFSCVGKKWTNIKIVDKKVEVFVPKEILKKIPEIHFETVALLWGDAKKSAFGSGNFHIELEVGTLKSVEEFPTLHLFFTDKKFVNAKIWRQISKDSWQGSDFN